MSPDAPGALPGAELVLYYAKIWPRVKAALIDGVILTATHLLAAVVGARVEGFGAVAFLAWLAFLILYDPVMVCRGGGTIGHRLQNLQVVANDTGRRPSFFVALVRNVMKLLLGFVSLLAMARSSRQEAVHDWFSGTTVQARDPRRARLHNFTRVRL